ncbi:MAG: DUF2270 domain-containing protein [Deltaproteobacteria bacterium]|nr:DUF2270 domain-containing protein [Deltaproteobacteria bacterium]
MVIEVDPADRSTILTHYYRAMVGRADVWRMRMDATTNWAIGATAAILSFSLGNDQVPHYAVFIAALLTLGFLQLEARRLTFYHLWQQRVLLLENGLVRPALNLERRNLDGPEEGAVESATGGDEARPSRGADGLAEALDVHLGQTIPSMPMIKAVARRLRRVYLYLFGVQLLAWTLKLWNDPEQPAAAWDLVRRAHIGALPGWAVWSSTLLLSVAALVLAYRVGGVDRDPA